MEAVTDFLFLGSKITVDNECSHSLIKRHLLLGRKVTFFTDQPRQHVKKLSHWHHFADKDSYSQSYGFSSSLVQMWELDHKEGFSTEELTLLSCGVGADFWECPGQREDQSVLKEINPEYSSEGSMLKLKLQYPGRLIQRADELEKTLMLGKAEGKRKGGSRGWDG